MGFDFSAGALSTREYRIVPEKQVRFQVLSDPEGIRLGILGAEKLGLRQVNSFVGRDWTRSFDDNWPRFLKVWKPLIRFAEDHGVRIGID